MLDWSIENHGGNIYVDSKELPKESILTVDIETDEQDNIVCIGLTGNGSDVYVYFYPNNDFYTWLREKSLIGHDLKSAEIPWLAKYGFSMSHVYMDTKIQAYVYDSSRKKYGLKDLIKSTFDATYPTYKELTQDKELIKKITGLEKKLPKKLTLDKLPREIVAEYNACDVFWTHRLYLHFANCFTQKQREFLQKIEMPMNKLLYEVEQKGIKINIKEVRRIHNEHSKKRRQARKRLFQLGERFNPNSPKQVLPLLRLAGAEVTSTGEDVIKRYAHIPFVSTLLDYREYQKVTSTYTIPLYFNAVHADDNRIHAHFVQNTITGRLSSSDPINLQNQPPTIRSAFVAEEGKLLIDADWTNVELYLPAHFSGEPNFINVLKLPDGDLHIQTARAIFGDLPTSEIAEKRKIAKTCNFLLTNSGSARRLQSELSITQKEAEGIYKKFWEGYPVLATWLKETKRQARTEGGVTTLFGRRVGLPQLNLWCGRSNCPVFGPNGFFCKECFIREETERQAISIKVQGSAADLMKLAALRLRREYGLVPIALVHDELLYEEPENKVEEVKERVKNVMESLVTLKVPLKAKVNTGRSWVDVH